MIRKITADLRARIVTSRTDSSLLDKTLSASYDVCVVGSGPGGSVAAATLAEAGMKVLLVERGPFLPAEQFNFQVLDMSNKLGRVELTSGLRTLLYQGNVLGGGSVLYGGVAMKPPAYVFEEWKERSGYSDLDLEQLEPHYRHVGDMMSVTRQSERLENRSNAIVREMADALGKPEGLETVDRYTKGCAGAGLCNLGCGFDLKGNMLNSFLPHGLETGNLTIVTECQAEGIGGETCSPAIRPGRSFRGTGLAVALRDFSTGRIVRRAFIKARRVILAAGAFFSSSLLLKSGVQFPNRDRIGAKIYLQPHAHIFALFDHPVTQRGKTTSGQYIPYNGVPAIYNFTGFLKEHRFFWLASILFPSNLASFISNLPPPEHFEIMRQFHNTVSITTTLRDEPTRSRIVLKDGRAQLDFRESPSDIENLRRCFLAAARGFLAVGARRVFLPLLDPPAIEREADLAKIESMRFGYDNLLLYSDHTSGGNSYGVDPEHGVTDPDGRVFGSQNVYVADSSLFPSGCGINPSWTIMALSRRVALKISEDTRN